MQRRRLLQLGLASAAVLVIAGGAASRIEPGLIHGKLSTAGRTVFAAVGRAVLDGSLPTDPQGQAAALAGLLDRIDAIALALPPHAQAELSQLLALMATSAGRIAFIGLPSAWAETSVPVLQDALQTLRTSRLALRRQAYQALHDLVGGAYFSDAATWPFLGYPGPLDI